MPSRSLITPTGPLCHFANCYSPILAPTVVKIWMVKPVYWSPAHYLATHGFISIHVLLFLTWSSSAITVLVPSMSFFVTIYINQWAPGVRGQSLLLAVAKLGHMLDSYFILCYKLCTLPYLLCRFPCLFDNSLKVTINCVIRLWVSMTYILYKYCISTLKIIIFLPFSLFSLWLIYEFCKKSSKRQIQKYESVFFCSSLNHFVLFRYA